MGRDVPESAYLGAVCPECGGEMIDLMGDDICSSCDGGGYAPTAPWQTGYPENANAILDDLEKQLSQIARDCTERESQMLEMFAAAYLKITDINPQDAVLVRKIDKDTVRWWFERRDERS